MRVKLALSLLLLLFIVFNISVITQALFEYKEIKTLTLYAPAVTSSGQGILTEITLAIASPGYGRVFLSALPYTEIETQGAARIAAYVASLVASKDFSQFDYYVLMESTSPIVGGPSAGGLITVGLVSLLLDLPIYSNMTMTGMINPDGSIGPVGGLIEKLQAASSNGLNVFLIPSGQRIYTYPVYEETKIGRFIIRRVKYEQVDLVELGKQLNINVYEVFSLLDALFYFTGLNLTRSIEFHRLPLSQIYSKLGPYIDALINKTASAIENSTKLAQRITNPYYRYQYLSQLSQLNSSLSTLMNIKDNYPAYTAVSLIDLYKSSIIYNWYLQISFNELSTNDIMRYVNESIINFHSSINIEICKLSDSFAQFLTYLAWRQYLNSMGSQDMLTVIQYLGEAISLIEQARLYTLFQSRVELNCSHQAFLEIYSHSYATYAYVSKLLSDLGIDMKNYVDLTNYLDVFNLPYAEGNVGAYAGFAYIYAYSTHNLHRALNTLDTLIQGKDKLISMYYSDVNDEVLFFYIELLNEGLTQGDRLQASFTLIVLISIINIFRINKIIGGVDSTTHTSPLITSQDQAGPKNTTDIISTTHKGELISEDFKRDLEIIVLLALTIVILLLIIRILNALKSTK
ncbi:MAG: S16 family serine protease [Desulfurococcaceae archaeon]